MPSNTKRTAMFSPIPRRTLLRGAGAALGLPWLEAMLPRARASATAKPPVRMAALYMPNGVREDRWTPASTGDGFALTPMLEPLRGLERQLLVLTNLWNQNSKGGEGHYVKISGWLTCTTITKTLGVDINCNGVSMDQVAAQRAGHLTPLASLELGIAPVTTGVDQNVGYTRVYGSHVSWASPTAPLARELNPRLVFERMLRAANPQPDAARRDIPLLDRVLEDARRLRTQLGAADQRRLDEYLSVVRSLEQRLERAALPKQTSWQARASFDLARRPEGTPKDYAEHVRLMMDMIVLAFQTDSTRICTFLFGNEVSNQNFSFLPGVTEGHHSVSHHEKDEAKLRQYEIIGRWHVEQYAYLLRRLSEIQEGESTVLDNSMILFGSGLRDGNKHDPHNLPVLVAGKGGGRLAAGRHLSYSPDTPVANLYVSMLDAFGTPVERFADSTGPLAGTLAS